jgi:hypothetical protein
MPSIKSPILLLNIADSLIKSPTYPAKEPCIHRKETHSDMMRAVASKLDGDFAFALAGDNGEFYAARDPIGVASMYMGWGSDGSVWFASEMKTLQVPQKSPTVSKRALLRTKSPATSKRALLRAIFCSCPALTRLCCRTTATRS